MYSESYKPIRGGTGLALAYGRLRSMCLFGMICESELRRFVCFELEGDVQGCEARCM